MTETTRIEQTECKSHVIKITNNKSRFMFSASCNLKKLAVKMSPKGLYSKKNKQLCTTEQRHDLLKNTSGNLAQRRIYH